MSNVLDLFDQTAFAGERATGTTHVLQCIWVYNRGVDLDGLRRFHRHLQRGRLSRRIERSPLPIGRHRWVTPGGQPDLEIVETPRTREEFDAWLDEQADTPIDAEHGPAWHLAVLPFTDGGAGVSFVVSHCLTDGVGLCEALADAASGRHDPISWPAVGSRPRWRALREDAHQTASDVPRIGRAVVAAARFARRNRGGDGSGRELPKAPRSSFIGTDERLALPAATIFVDADEWDERARSLRGTSNALLAGLASRLAERVGRVGADRSVTLAIPVNERSAGDTRANAITGVDVIVDPAAATTDLREIRAAIKEALTHRQEVPDERKALLALAPLLPRWLMKRIVGAAAGGAATSGSSNLGVVNPAANRPDGTDADHFAMRTLFAGMSRATAHRTAGILGLLSGRAHGQVFVSVLAYQPGRPNSKEYLRQNLSGALNDFSLTATIGWPCPDRASAAG
jgi:wax ester synthase-like acyl-CoA acyltransferase family protein